MIYFFYAAFTAWLIMVLVNYHSHKKYIMKNKDRFIKILDRMNSEDKNFSDVDPFYFSFTPDQIEKREFTKYLKLGKFKYILSDTTQIVFSFMIVFVLSYGLEYMPFINYEYLDLDTDIIFFFMLIGYLICVLDAYTKTRKYDMIIKCWKEQSSRNCEEDNN